MALGSPGVEVKVIDESFYTPAAPGTIPLLFVATAQDKNNASGTGIAAGTTAANAGKVWVITSQRDLTETFGTPLFYTDNNSNPIHGGELNEYGLQAAYSLLGVSSRVYVVRADADLGQLQPQNSAPEGEPTAGTYWLDTSSTVFGINEWDATTKKFTVKTPIIINNDNRDVSLDTLNVPLSSVGKKGDYAVVATSDNDITVFYKTSANIWVVVRGTFDGGKSVTIAPHTSYPDFTSSGSNAVTGSVWIKTTTPGQGANWSVKYYNGSTQAWSTVSAPIYASTRHALQNIDFAGGGKNIPTGTLFVESDYLHYGSTNVASTSSYASFKVWRRNSTSPTTIVTAPSTYSTTSNTTFYIRESVAGGTNWSSTATITVPGSTNSSVVSLIPAAISAAGLTNVSASYDATSKKLSISHDIGGDFQIKGGTLSLSSIGLTPYNVVTKAGTANLYDTANQDDSGFLASNWKPLVFESSSQSPSTDPADGTLWFSSVVDEVDIMVHNGTTWVGYQTAFPGTDPNGPIVAALKPETQSNGDDLVNGDIWISTADIDNYGKNVYVWDGSLLEWVLQDTSDQSSPTGWLFADARWSTSGEDKNPATISALLTSDYLDPDAPDPALYPKGLRLWNLRRSGFNVKKYISGHLNLEANNGINPRYNTEPMTNYVSDRWVTISPNDEAGVGSFGRMAQRRYVVSRLKATVDTNQAIRDTDTLLFNLISCPGYPEAIQNMVAFNVDIGQTAFVIGDTPFRLKPNGTELTEWGNNINLAFDNGDVGAVSYDEYMAMFYPSGFTTDNFGNNIVVPPSHMILRMILNSDAKSYQWFAPAGTRRGGIDNATSVGYIDSLEGEFKTVSLYEGLRNVLADVKINPIATLPGVGIVNFGQYTRARNASALDRINVSRLVAYLRRQLSILAKPYLFEPNDEQTRREIKAAAESLLLELVGQRALYDFIVVCDKSNNTPSRIDRNELYMDIAIEPVKAVEFIYIPLRIKNTGEISSGA
jgi:hypothetical protein